MIFEVLKTNDDLYDRAIRVKGENWRPRGGIKYVGNGDGAVLIKNCTQDLKEEDIFPKNKHLPFEVRALINYDIQVSPEVERFFKK